MTRQLRIHVEDLHGHQYRHYEATLERCGFEVARLGDASAPPADVILQMRPSLRLHPEIPTVGSVHSDQRLNRILAGTANGPAMAASFQHWIVKREADAERMRRRYGLSVAVTPYFYPDLGDAKPREASVPGELLCASYINCYSTVCRDIGWRVFQQIQSRLGERCMLYGTDAPSGAVTDDAARFQQARFTLHVKHGGYLCNAVIRSLAAGVPVVMDRETWAAGRYEGVLEPGEGVVVLSGPDEIVAFLQDTNDAQLGALDRAAWQQGERFRRPPEDFTAVTALFETCAAEGA